MATYRVSMSLFVEADDEAEATAIAEIEVERMIEGREETLDLIHYQIDEVRNEDEYNNPGPLDRSDVGI